MVAAAGPVASSGTVITMGARDLAVQREFYRRLGWPVLRDDGESAAFELPGAVLALLPVERLAADGRTEPNRAGGIRVSLGVIVERPEDVDAMAETVRRAGGRVTRQPEETASFVGRSAYFADPEENYWEIAWAPPDNPTVAAARRAAGLDPWSQGRTG